MKTRIGMAIFGAVLAATAINAEAHENDRSDAQRLPRDYSQSFDFRNDHRHRRDHERDREDRDNDWRNHGRHDHRHESSAVVYADVISVVPIIEYVYSSQPVRECRTVGTVSYERQSAGPGLLLGGVIGGAIGQDIARSTGNDVAIVAGTLIGAAIGHDISHTRTTVVTQPQYECNSHQHQHREERITGYQVQYRYAGRIYSTHTDRHPGDHIRVTITLN